MRYPNSHHHNQPTREQQLDTIFEDLLPLQYRYFERLRELGFDEVQAFALLLEYVRFGNQVEMVRLERGEVR